MTSNESGPKCHNYNFNTKNGGDQIESRLYFANKVLLHHSCE